MKFNNLFFVFISILFFIVNAKAQQFTVKQMKGDKAIIELQNGEKLQLGQTYNINTTGFAEDAAPVASTAKKNERQHLIGLDFSLSNTKTDQANAENILDLQTSVKYGWNTNRFEYGPIVALGYTKNGSAKPATLIGLGGFGTYNFQPNSSGKELIFSADAQLSYNLIKQGDTVTTNETSILVGPFVKWFGLSNDHCFRAGLVFTLDNAKTETKGASSTTSNSVSTTGFAAVIGLSNYF